MKLKKIASLMLAGVMAVSMLAGCSGKGTDNKGEETVTASTLTGKVISALDEDTTKKVAFSSSSVLDAAIAKAVQQVGVDDTISNDLLNQINSDISEKDELAAIGTASYKNNKNKAKSDGEKASATWVMNTSFVTAGASEAYVVKQIADQLDNDILDTLKDKLDSHSITYNIDGEEYYYTFKYTGDLSVVKVSDVVTGVSDYVVVYTITRTPTKVDM